MWLGLLHRAGRRLLNNGYKRPFLTFSVEPSVGFALLSHVGDLPTAGEPLVLSDKLDCKRSAVRAHVHAKPREPSRLEGPNRIALAVGI